jgi:putative glutamine amidotransferase
VKKAPPLIGITARIHYRDLAAQGTFRQDLYLSQTAITDCISALGALAVTLPSDSLIESGMASAYASRLDGLILQGGADVAPQSYGQKPRHFQWRGDARRDAAEMSYFDAFFKAGKPILGLCRGAQLINVALGGTLYQDLPTERAGSIQHSDRELYSEHLHSVQCVDGGRLSQIYGTDVVRVNSIHHQGIDTLAKSLIAEAYCTEDKLVEAVAHRDTTRFVIGVQWHAELMWQVKPPCLNAEPLFAAFLGAAELPQAPTAATKS